MNEPKKTAEQQRDDFDSATATILSLTPSLIEYYSVHAKLLFEKKKALLKAGFSEAEVLEILKARPGTEI